MAKITQKEFNEAYASLDWNSGGISKPITYTQEQLEGMNDHKINHAIRRIKFGSYAYDPDMRKQKLDYCNNPSDMWPLIVEAKIGNDYCYIEKTHIACWVENGDMFSGKAYLVKNKNPLRAAAIVYILVKQKESKRRAKND